MAPFRDFLTLILLDGDFNLPQNGFADLADSTAQGGNGFRGVEIQNRLKVLITEGCFQPTPGHKGIGGADRSGVDECHAFVIVMIPLQVGTVNDAEDVLLMIQPILGNQDSSNLIQLLTETI